MQVIKKTAADIYRKSDHSHPPCSRHRRSNQATRPHIRRSRCCSGRNGGGGTTWRRCRCGALREEINCLRRSALPLDLPRQEKACHRPAMAADGAHLKSGVTRPLIRSLFRRHQDGIPADKFKINLALSSRLAANSAHFRTFLDRIPRSKCRSMVSRPVVQANSGKKTQRTPI